jgi:hypothetical protein
MPQSEAALTKLGHYHRLGNPAPRGWALAFLFSLDNGATGCSFSSSKQAKEVPTYA